MGVPLFWTIPHVEDVRSVVRIAQHNGAQFSTGPASRSSQLHAVIDFNAEVGAEVTCAALIVAFGVLR